MENFHVCGNFLKKKTVEMKRNKKAQEKLLFFFFFGQNDHFVDVNFRVNNKDNKKTRNFDDNRMTLCRMA